MYRLAFWCILLVLGAVAQTAFECAALTRRRRYEAPSAGSRGTHIAHLTRRRRFHGTTSELTIKQIVELSANSTSAPWGGELAEVLLKKGYATLLGFYTSAAYNPEYQLSATFGSVRDTTGSVMATLTTVLPATPDACTSRDDAAARLQRDPSQLTGAMQAVQAAEVAYSGVTVWNCSHVSLASLGPAPVGIPAESNGARTKVLIGLVCICFVCIVAPLVWFERVWNLQQVSKERETIRLAAAGQSRLGVSVDNPMLNQRNEEQMDMQEVAGVE